MATQSDYSDEQIAAALFENRSNLTATARSLSLKRAALVDRINRTPDLKAAQEESRDGLIDQAEQNVYHSVFAGDDQMTRFVLTTLGKDRGYTTKSEVENKHSFDGQNAVDLIMEARRRIDSPPNSSETDKG